MKYWTLAIATAVLLALSTPTLAKDASDSEQRSHQSIWLGGSGKFVNWRAVSRDELIIWRSPSKPYLVKIWRPFTNLRFVHAIGVTTTTGRLTEFDKVIVDGERLPIKSIQALDRETAKNLQWKKS